MQDTDRAATLGQMILIWAAMLLGQVGFVVVVIVSHGRGGGGTGASGGGGGDVGDMLHLISWIMLAAGTPLGYFIRNQVYKANWRGEVITPRGYMTGNILLWAIIDGAAMTALVAAMLSASPWAALAPAGIAMLVHVINFPTGKPMRPMPTDVNPYADLDDAP